MGARHLWTGVEHPDRNTNTFLRLSASRRQTQDRPAKHFAHIIMYTYIVSLGTSLLKPEWHLAGEFRESGIATLVMMTTPLDRQVRRVFQGPVDERPTHGANKRPQARCTPRPPALHSQHCVHHISCSGVCLHAELI